MPLIVALLLGLAIGTSQAEELLQLPSGESIGFERLGVGGTARVLLFPADEGFLEQELAFARGLAAQGFEVVYPRLHESYFLNTGPFSLSKVPIADLVALLARIDTGELPLLLIANQRVSVIALQTARNYQITHPGRSPVGLVLLSPYLEARPLGAGEPMEYHPSAAHSNLPLYVIQSRVSSRMFSLRDTVGELEKGGSPVFFQVVPDARDAFHIWPEEIWPSETRERQRLPRRIRSAFDLMQGYPAAPITAGAIDPGQPRSQRIAALPEPIRGTPAAAALGFPDLDGRHWRLEDLRGQVVLLNFWTTWCPPCVEELPSLQRLNARMQHAEFAVVSVDLGEEAQAVAAFLGRHQLQLDYPVLLDTEGLTAKRWGINAFPTSFVLDRSGRVRYGLVGAIDWDSQEVVALVEKLLAE